MTEAEKFILENQIKMLGALGALVGISIGHAHIMELGEDSLERLSDMSEQMVKRMEQTDIFIQSKNN